MHTQSSKATLSVEDLPKDGVALRLPAHQKTGFYSAFADVFHQADDSGLPPLTLEQCCEILLPVGFVTTAINYRQLWLSRLQDPEFDRSKNLTLYFLEACLEEYGGIVKGAGQRCTVSFNHSVTEREIINSLKILKGVIEKVNRPGGERMDHRKATETLKTIKGINDLQAQHILAVGTLAGIINRPEFVATAHICRGTTTWKKIQQVFNLKEAVMNRLYDELAEELSIDTATVENVACEYFRDVEEPTADFDPEAYEKSIAKRRLRDGKGYSRPDVCFLDQNVYTYCVSADTKEAVISRSSHTQPAMAVEPRDFGKQSNSCAQRWSIVSPKREYKVSVGSKLAISNQARQPRRMKKITNFGLGVHQGLAEHVKEREKKRLRGMSMIIEKDETYQCNILKGKRYLIDMLEKKMTRSSEIPLHEYVFLACKDDKTYRYIDLVTTAVRNIHGQSVKRGKNGRVKKLRDYIKCHKHIADCDGQAVWTATINSAKQTTMPANHPALPVRGYVGNFLSKDGKNLAYYDSEESARRAVLTFALVVCPPKFNNNKYLWASNLLGESSQLGFVVLYSGKKGSPDELFGILTRSKEDDKQLVLSVPVHSHPLENLDIQPWQDYYVGNDVVKTGRRTLSCRASRMPRVNYVEASSVDSCTLYNDDDDDDASSYCNDTAL